MHRSRTQSVRTTCTLYFIVFSSVYTKLSIALLFAAFLLQPIAPAYANESVTTENELVESTEQLAETAEDPEPKEKKLSQSDDTEVDEIVSDETEPDTTDETTRSSTEGNGITDVQTDETNDVSDTANQDESDGSKVNAVVSAEGVHTDAADEEVNVTDQQTDESSEAATSTSNEVADIENTAATIASTDSEDQDSQIASSTNKQRTSINDDSGSSAEDAANDALGVDATSTPATASSSVKQGSDVNDQKESEEKTQAESAEDMVRDTGESQLATSTQTTGTTTGKMMKTGSTATTTVEAERRTEVQTLSTAINDANRHQFSVDECVSVGGGAFYCNQNETEESKLLHEDGVYAAPDSDGDMEIFVRVKGVVEQLTDNLYDDAAPYFDPLSQRVVWHALKNDRYQIAVYDFATQETKYLTAATYNNMEPVAYGELIIWQAWIDSDWEIVLFDGASTTVLTDNNVHDVAPHVRGDYIVWQTQFIDGWQVAIYDQNSGSIEYVENGSGGLVENPRFVLVYDSEEANGDVRTYGYDFDSKLAIPLSSLPRPLPERLPEPDTTGEERALVQSKPTPREEVVIGTRTGTNTSSTLTPNSTTTPNVVMATSSDIIIPPLQPTAATTEDTQATSSPEVSIDNVDMRAIFSESTTTSSSTDHIEDVIIPPTASTTDAQTE